MSSTLRTSPYDLVTELSQKFTFYEDLTEQRADMLEYIKKHQMKTLSEAAECLSILDNGQREYCATKILAQKFASKIVPKDDDTTVSQSKNVEQTFIEFFDELSCKYGFDFDLIISVYLILDFGIMNGLEVNIKSFTCCIVIASCSLDDNVKRLAEDFPEVISSEESLLSSAENIRNNYESCRNRQRVTKSAITFITNVIYYWLEQTASA